MRASAAVIAIAAIIAFCCADEPMFYGKWVPPARSRAGEQTLVISTTRGPAPGAVGAIPGGTHITTEEVSAHTSRLSGGATGNTVAGNWEPGNTLGISPRASDGECGKSPAPVPPPREYGPDGAPNDERNWMVARYKGGKYGVAPALLIAIRSHENPRRSRDRYALGVKAFKWTNIWVQYDWGAKIVARIARRQGWDPMNPTRENLYRLALIYVGQGRAAARHWQKSVWQKYRREH